MAAFRRGGQGPQSTGIRFPRREQDQTGTSGPRRRGAQSLLVIDAVGRCRHHLEQDPGAGGQKSVAEPRSRADDPH